MCVYTTDNVLGKFLTQFIESKVCNIFLSWWVIAFEQPVFSKKSYIL